MSGSFVRKLANGLEVQRQVIHALMIRELITRFGRENIGFLWIMVEPLLFAGLVGTMWHFMKGSTEHGVSVVAFTATGYIPLTFFRHCVSRSVSAFTANQSLLYHRQIKVVDIVCARFIIEMLGGMMAYLVMALFLGFIGEFPIPANIGLLIGGWALYSLFCFSLCLILSPLSEMSEAMEKFIPVTTYIMIPISGAFYMVSWVTPGMKKFLLLSPFVNGMEMMREGVWGEQLTANYDPWNPILCSVVLSLIGLILCRRVRRTLNVE
jgi:capsular polysaccharide transport system permease protein